MGEMWFPWAVVVLLVVLLTAVILWVRRDRARTRARAAEQMAETRRVDEQRAVKHRAEQEQRAAAHRAELERRDASHRAELERRDDEAASASAELARFKRAATDNIENELVSRDVITSLCEELRIDGILATNVMFLPFDAAPGAPFWTQVDHVLLTETFAVVIENKYWKGVVFDGVLPSSVHSSFGTLVPDEALSSAPSYAVSIVRPDDATELKLRIHTGRQAPRSQVRLHAKRVSELMRSRLGQAGWLDTVVFYSHPNVVLHTAPRAGASRTAETPVAAGAAQLRSVIAEIQRSRSRSASVPVSEIARIFADLGADMRGFGSFASLWTSTITSEDARFAQKDEARRRAERQSAG